MSADNPILNSPYLEPKLHYDTDSEGSLDYTRIRQGHRIFKADIAVIPTKQTGQKEIFAWMLFFLQEYRNDTCFTDYLIAWLRMTTIYIKPTNWYHEILFRRNW